MEHRASDFLTIDELINFLMEKLRSRRGRRVVYTLFMIAAAAVAAVPMLVRSNAAPASTPALIASPTLLADGRAALPKGTVTLPPFLPKAFTNGFGATPSTVTIAVPASSPNAISPNAIAGLIGWPLPVPDTTTARSPKTTARPPTTTARPPRWTVPPTATTAPPDTTTVPPDTTTTAPAPPDTGTTVPIGP